MCETIHEIRIIGTQEKVLISFLFECREKGCGCVLGLMVTIILLIVSDCLFSFFLNRCVNCANYSRLGRRCGVVDENGAQITGDIIKIFGCFIIPDSCYGFDLVVVSFGNSFDKAFVSLLGCPRLLSNFELLCFFLMSPPHKCVFILFPFFVAV